MLDSLNVLELKSKINLYRFLPDENSFILRNGRKISYNFLVCAMGLNQNIELIKGLEEAWKDVNHPVYTNKVFKFIKGSSNLEKFS